MQNNDLKSLVTQIYDNLLDHIDQQEDPTKEQLVNYLKDAVITIENMDDHKLDSTENTKEAFTNAYKDIADSSLSSYHHTNQRFEQLSQMHEETINQYEEHINLPAITEKFNEIQAHMSSEVQKANQIISQLSHQVKTLEEASTVDALTRVFNRRALISHLNKICANDGVDYVLHALIL